MGKHFTFLSRTVIVAGNNVEQAYETLRKALTKEGIFKQAIRNQYFEKPYEQRNRVSYERCKRIYDGEMKRKISFVLRKNRTNPFPR